MARLVLACQTLTQRRRREENGRPRCKDAEHDFVAESLPVHENLPTTPPVWVGKFDKVNGQEGEFEVIWISRTMRNAEASRGQRALHAAVVEMEPPAATARGDRAGFSPPALWTIGASKSEDTRRLEESIGAIRMDPILKRPERRLSV
jgi:hypothetical protein